MEMRTCRPHIYISLCISVYLCISIYVYMYKSRYLYILICVYLYIYEYIYIYVRAMARVCLEVDLGPLKMRIDVPVANAGRVELVASGLPYFYPHLFPPATMCPVPSPSYLTEVI